MYTPYVAKFTSGEWERFPGLAFMTSAEAEEISVLQKELHDYAKNQLARWISGDGNVNAEWDNYLKELDKIGLQRYLQVMQGVYNRYKGK
jgi:putative aldouronate transport system substrate-binding protein